MMSSEQYVPTSSYDLSRMKTSSEVRNRAIATNVDAGTPAYKIYHSLVIADLALAIADQVEKQEGVKLNRETIEAGAILHDLGISQTLDDLTPEHAMIGAIMARSAGWSEAVARVIQFHDGGGYVPLVVRELNLPSICDKEDTLSETWEEKIVAYADLAIYTAGELGLDLWNDPWSPAKGEYSYLVLLYQRRRGLKFTKNHPQLQYLTDFHKQMIKYCPREMYEQFQPGVEKMLWAMRLNGIPIPPVEVPSVW